MPANAIIETHIDAILKQEAETILAAEGLTIDEFIQTMLQRTVTNHAVPYGILAPTQKPEKPWMSFATAVARALQLLRT